MYGGFGQPIDAIDLVADPRIWETNLTDGSPIPGYEPFHGAGVPMSTTGRGPHQAGAFFGPGTSLKGQFLRLYADAGYAGSCRIMALDCCLPRHGFYDDSGNCPLRLGKPPRARGVAGVRVAKVRRSHRTGDGQPTNGARDPPGDLSAPARVRGRTHVQQCHPPQPPTTLTTSATSTGLAYGCLGVTNTTPIIFGGMVPLYDYEVHAMEVTHAIAQLKYKAAALIGYRPPRACSGATSTFRATTSSPWHTATLPSLGVSMAHRLRGAHVRTHRRAQRRLLLQRIVARQRTTGHACLLSTGRPRARLWTLWSP